MTFFFEVADQVTRFEPSPYRMKLPAKRPDAMIHHVLIGTNTEDYEAIINAAESGGKLPEWVVPKDAQPGDRAAFFVRVSGVVAVAAIASEPTRGTFGKRQVYRAGVSSVKLLPTSVPLEYIVRELPEWKWATYPRTHTTPPSSVGERLYAILGEFQSDLGSQDDSEEQTHREGRARHVNGVRYERDPVARARCILHHGAVCAVCGFQFAQFYGPLVENLIVVHHLNPIALRGGEHVVDPINDMRPVCGNCHLVIHRKSPPYTIDEVQRMMNEAEQWLSEVPEPVVDDADGDD